MTPAASPRGRSAAAGHLSIGQVLARLTPEFPELSASKLRYLEEQGLVTPLRTEAAVSYTHLTLPTKRIV